MKARTWAQVQHLQGVDQGLVVARLAEARSSGPAFRPAELEDLFISTGLPEPSRVSNLLRSLENMELVRRGAAKGTWRLTPKGRAKAQNLVADVDLVSLAAATSDDPAVVLGHVRHTLIPPSFAPPELLPSLGRFLDRFPFETNVFAMTRFPSQQAGPDDPVASALQVAQEVCVEHGLRLHLASDRAISDDLWRNIAAHMWASKYGIAIFEDRVGRGMNYNLTLEVGSMIMTGRRCVLLKDTSVESLPTDLIGRIYRKVDVSQPKVVGAALHDWVRDDLAHGPCGVCAPA